ncbi:unnamed protein product [marine sediment metagenome]|uniref:HNH nuclease domain-containing protein n=1 Tax=marine sediment metagenome TaxID=412755 RepID=X1RAK6_9ZZZZ
MFDFLDEKKERTSIGKMEWEAIKKRGGNKCLMCGRTEKSAGVLDKAHIKAHSKGGTQYFPLCPTCHRKFDSGKATASDLKKLGISKEVYIRLRPKKAKRKTSTSFF